MKSLSSFAQIFAALLVTTLCALPVCAGETTGQYSEQRLNEAKKQYVRLFIATSEKMRLPNGMEAFTEAEIAENSQALTEWLDHDLIPFLRNQGVLNDFIDLNLDTELLEMHELALRSKSGKALWASLRAIDARVEKKYPRIYRVEQTEQYRNVFLRKLISNFPARKGVFRMPYKLTVRGMPKGEEQILEQLSGALKRFDRTVAADTEASKLEFRLVHENSDRMATQRLAEFKRNNPNGDHADEKKFLEENAPAGYELLSFSEANADGQIVRRYYYVSKNVEMDGERVCKASVDKDLWGIPTVDLSFDNGGTEAFAELTGKNIGRLLAVVFDGRLLGAPRINAAITGGDIRLNFNFSDSEAKAVADVLNTPTHIDFRLSKAEEHGCGKVYVININKQKITVYSHTREGLRRGAQKLCDLLRAAPTPELKTCVISE